MKSLKERQKRREHDAAVYKGEVDDSKVLHGLDGNGNVIDDSGEGKEGTKAKGSDAKDGEVNETKPFDASKLTSHDALDKAVADNGLEKPEGWDDREKFKVADKQSWLTANVKPAGETGWN